MKFFTATLVSMAVLADQVSSYAFVGRPVFSSSQSLSSSVLSKNCPSNGSSSRLSMVDGNVLAGVGIAVAGIATGIGMVAFAEAQGERAKERGSGLSENMSTQLSGMLMEDVEVSTVSDLSSLTSQLEEALKATGGTSEEELELSEEEKKRLEEEADDGW
eukprot:CAMPEP_0113452746 /NCGR_PEP_ID=MMETSP0014_2-20120614/7003_1 /TAXON_ID=2857 /ORGANISM="Nitzschia sp." /LENGTH=159 /DNA_ID=CAMNT_0000344123 /DNA_START=3017 /DNA_END=3493 /DNA_ORIENTATION=+ /assembly_acc=CAM_ASM_000159